MFKPVAAGALAGLLLSGCASAQVKMPDQRHHWQLLIVAVETKNGNPINTMPANHVSYESEAACVAVAEQLDALLSVESADGKIGLTFGCKAEDKTDV